jgi:ABC-2 type transport system permease protein
MFNLIKYELRGKFLTILGICLTVIIGNLFLLTKVGSWEIGVPVLSGFLGSSALIVICLSSLTLMSDYLYDDQGYLLFTLPQSGVAIMASRLIAAVIQIGIVTIVSALMFCLLDQGRILNIILHHVAVAELLYSILMHLWTIVSALTFIYFCMVVGRVALKGKKLGKIGSFIIFFLLSIAKAGVTLIIADSFPQIVQLQSVTAMTINIGSIIFDIITFVILFMATSYLLEHKVEL